MISFGLAGAGGPLRLQYSGRREDSAVEHRGHVLLKRSPMPPLLSRVLDPILGVFTGALAYYLYETNPRTAPAKEDTLRELIRWKREKWQAEQSKRDAEAEAEFTSASRNVS